MLLASAAAFLLAVATTQPPAPTPPSDQKPQPQPVSLEQLPPALRLGIRVEGVRQNLPVIPTLVIAPDAPSYIGAIAAWRTTARFPVLIDDGSWQAQQDIARFVRAFEPASVVRWSSPAAVIKDAWAGSDGAARRLVIENAVAMAWDAPAAPALKDHWKTIGLVPPGVVVALETDPAWPAALALAAGRGQPILWLPPPAGGGIDGEGVPSSVDDFCRAIEQGCAATGLKWDGLGDDLEAVTICLNAPVKISLPASDQRQKLAVTDQVGRHLDGDRSRRWAWAGQVVGPEPRAAYSAMSALFLNPTTAWLFDGYETEGDFGKYDCTAAARELERGGFRTTVFDAPRQGAEDFRRAAAGTSRGGLDAGLIIMNTMGNWDFFDLRPGQCKPGDIPLLARPSMVYLVHSWSAMQPGNRGTVGGRWLERGAYAYFGSVNEPYLSAFVPTPMAARRIAAHLPWGAAVRFDGGPVWKLAVLGDPLITVGSPVKRLGEARLPLEGATDVNESLRDALKGRRFAEAVRTLALLGRDADAAALLASIARDDPAALTPEVARAGIMSAFLQGRTDEVVAAYSALLPAGEPGRTPELRDILWHTLYPTINTLRPRELDLLKQSLRPEQLVRDALDAARAIQAVRGPTAVQAFVSEVLPRLPDDATRKQFEAELAK